MASGNQTPAPKSSTGTPLYKQATPELKKAVHEAEKGAAKKASATKTPQKIQDGKTARDNKE